MVNSLPLKLNQKLKKLFLSPRQESVLMMLVYTDYLISCHYLNIYLNSIDNTVIHWILAHVYTAALNWLPFPYSIGIVFQKEVGYTQSKVTKYSSCTVKLHLHAVINQADFVSWCMLHMYEGNKMYSWENTMYFHEWIIKSHSPGYEIGQINCSM